MGRTLRRFPVTKRNVAVLSEAEFDRLSISFEVPAEVGFYRVDFDFKDKRGKQLGHYAEYLRVLRPTWSTKLGLSQQLARPGEVLYFRVENFGTSPVRYGEPFLIETFDGGGWREYPLNGAWHRPLFRISGGHAGQCQSFTVPNDMPPGLYRVKKRLVSPSRSITSEFKVLS